MAILETIVRYIQLGYTHVIPFGFDHVLFVLCLVFLSTNVKSIIIQCSLFTIAHSLSLGFVLTGLILPNSYYVEIFIAFTLLFTSVENILIDKVYPYRLVLIFIFGLIHGMGFANALKEVGILKNQLYTALFSFNLGVELAQITIIFLSYFLISKRFSNKKYYKERIVYPISTLVACIAVYWIIERMVVI